MHNQQVAMPKLPCINVLVSSADQYFKYKSDIISEMLLRYLQELSIHQDTTIYSHVKKDANKLFICLHQLISNLEPNSNVLWAAVRLFEKCCCSVSAHCTSIPSHKFIAPITELLLSDLTHDKKLCVLKILLELTKQMEVLEKEPCIQILTSKLTEFIMTEDADVVKYSLITLVNVCHNNSSVVYSLKSCIGGRFFRAVTNLQDDSITTKLQMCKLLFLLEPISLSVDGPPDISKTIIDITFSILIEAYKRREIMLLNNIVDFFKELTFFPTYVDLLHCYDRCPEYTQNIIYLLGQCDSETVCAVFDFVYALLCVKVPALLPVYPQIMDISIPWLGTDKVCTRILNVIRAIVLDMEKDTTVLNNIIHLLDQYLPCIFQLYSSIELPGNEECLVALLQLLQEIFRCEKLRTKHIQEINLQQIEEIFYVLTTQYEDTKCFKKCVLLCVSALNFLSSLSQYGDAYLKLRDKLCSSPEIQRILAAGFYEDLTRAQVLTFINASALPDESLSCLAKILSGGSAQVHSTDANTENNSMSKYVKIPFDLTKGGQVDVLVTAARQKLEINKIRNITVSTVMSLCEYKVSAASHTEQNLYTNLEIAQSHCTEMQQKLMEIDTRVQQMRELLLKNQQCAEYQHVEIQELEHIKDVDKITSRNNIKKYKEELSAKEKMLHRKQFESEDLKNKVKSVCETRKNLETNLRRVQEEVAATSNVANEHVAQINRFEQKLMEVDFDYTDRREKSEILEGVLENSKHVLAERVAEVASLKKENCSLERDIANLQMLNTAQIKTAEEKDQEIQKLQKQLSDLKRMRDLIADISSGKGNE